MSKIVAEQLVDMMGQAGIQRIYAVAGDSLNVLNDAIHRDGRIQWIHVHLITACMMSTAPIPKNAAWPMFMQQKAQVCSRFGSCGYT